MTKVLIFTGSGVVLWWTAEQLWDYIQSYSNFDPFDILTSEHNKYAIGVATKWGMAEERRDRLARN